jgi:hypothetical protein
MTCGPGGTVTIIFVACVSYRPGRGHNRPKNVFQMCDLRARGHGHNNICQVYDTRARGHGHDNTPHGV